jgi:glycosyltransferase involved in cell wall biosynthesis
MMWRTDETRASGRPIALLVNILSSGGAQRRIATLANRFAELGRAVDLVSFAAEGPMRAMLSPAVRLVPLARADVSGLRAYLDEARPAVLMSCVTDTHAAAVDAGAARSPVVLRASRHPYRSLPKGDLLGRLAEPVKRWRAARTYARADAIVALSEAGADALRRLLRPRAPRIEAIPNPVVERIWLDDLEGRGGRSARDLPLVLGVGRLVKQKDFATLIRAFAIVRAARPCRLVLLGEGAERPRLEALASRLGVAVDIEMPGEVDDVADRMRRADLLVSSSLWEGMQAVLIEALAAGCPVVATDCPGGARETLEGGRLGALVPVRAPAAMAQAMLGQLDSPPDPRMLAAAARRFMPDGKAERYLSLFDSLAARQPPRPVGRGGRSA